LELTITRRKRTGDLDKTGHGYSLCFACTEEVVSSCREG
jgi:hypothetical protein